MDRYVVISSDCHAGADMLEYRSYLESPLHEEFDAWAAAFVNPFGDLVRPDADRNWNTTRRVREMDADGVVAELLYTPGDQVAEGAELLRLDVPEKAVA